MISEQKSYISTLGHLIVANSLAVVTKVVTYSIRYNRETACRQSINYVRES